MAAAALALATSAYPLQVKLHRSQKHESRDEIFHLENVWRNAILSANTVAMGSLLADDYMGITPFGTLQTKDETLAGLRSGQIHFTALYLSDRKVRFYGATAVVTSLAQVQGKTAEGNVSGNYRYTRVYARDPQGNWKIVSFEASRVRQPGGRK
jgi:ketosteroid isomerase-like protein